jgi:hypothetical protein
MSNVESRDVKKEEKRKGGIGLTEERNVKLKGWVCCNGNASGEDLQIGYGTVRPEYRHVHG